MRPVIFQRGILSRSRLFGGFEVKTGSTYKEVRNGKHQFGNVIFHKEPFKIYRISE